MKDLVKTDKNNLLFSNKDLWSLIWPLLIEQTLQITVGMADVFMVASIGEAAVSGVSLVDNINILFINLFSALATGGAVVCSQYIGSRNYAKAKQTALQLIYTVFSVAFILMIIGLVFKNPILRITFGSIDQDVMDNAKKYFVITLFCFIPLGIYNSAAALFRAQGNSRVSMITSAIVNAINIGGNAIMIYGFNCGVEGVAIPTLFSRLIGATILIVLLYNSKESGNKTNILDIRGISKVKIDFSIISKILKIGIPNGLENSVFQLGKVIVLSLISYYGTIAIAANAAANTMAALGVIPASSIGVAMLTVIGQCIGAGKTEQAEYFTKKLMVISYVSMIIFNVPFIIALYKILTLYGMSDETTKLAYCMAMIHVCSAVVLWPMSFVFPNTLRAANDATFTMIISMISMWSIRVGGSYLFKYTGLFGFLDLLELPLYYGAVGVWIAMILDWILRIICFIVRYCKGDWKKRQLI